jgi:hypothetical protein
MSDSLKLALSGDHRAMPVFSTLIGSVRRHNPDRHLEVAIWTRGARPEGFRSAGLSVEFFEVEEPWGRGKGRFPAEMFDKFEVVSRKPEWDKCLAWGWDMVCKGSLEDLWARDLYGYAGAFVPARRRRGGWEWDQRLPAEKKRLLGFRFGGLWNLEELRKAQVVEQMREWYEAGIVKVPDHGLFAAAIQEWLPLERTWNAVPGDECFAEARVMHFSGLEKPWRANPPHAQKWREEFRSWRELIAEGRLDFDKPALA